MKCNRVILIWIAAAASTVGANGQSSDPAAQADPLTPIQRANDDAVARLYAQIACETIDDVSIAHLLEKVEGSGIVMNGLAKAEQIGGPRVVGDDFVQVQLQISGPRAALLIIQAVAVKPESSPIAVEKLAKRLQDWNQRVFTSTGASVEPTRMEMMPVESETTAPVATTLATDVRHLPELKLDTPPGWASDPIVAQAIAGRDGSSLRTARVAEQSARDTLRTEVYALKTSELLTVGELCSIDDSIAREVDRAIQSAKVSGVDYRADGSVEVRISIEGRQVWQSILSTR